MATQSLAATLFRAIPALTLMLAGGAGRRDGANGTQSKHGGGQQVAAEWCEGFHAAGVSDQGWQG